MKFNDLIELLLQNQLNEKPGVKAHRLMEPTYRNRLVVKTPLIDAAVLILLFPINNYPYFTLIKRTIDDRSPHSGQISFPGGRCEPYDKDIYHTALRESFEEVGIIINDVHYLDSLTPLTIPISGYRVHPFLAYIHYHPAWCNNEQEVKHILEVPLMHLLDNKNIFFEHLFFENEPHCIPYFRLENEKVWGATAMILAEFQMMLKTIFH